MSDLRWLLDNAPEDSIEEHAHVIAFTIGRLATLKRENEMLKEYATHKPGCYENSELCICGLDALLTAEEPCSK